MSKRTAGRKPLIVAGVVASMVLPASWMSQAQAQDQPSSRRIEEVIVTAERRESTVSNGMDSSSP